ncbi:hypothetical protein BJ138DRAFT_1013027, partial [Hygrophoropsis aurantiaca]
RTFNGPDGKSYMWSLGKWVPILYLNDGSDKVIARFHRSNMGIIGKQRSACLEISPEGEHMVDIIIITFIYIEKLRRRKESAG